MKERKETEDCAAAQAETRFTGVRKRAWGRWVSEIRLPCSRERVWLGSYSTAEEAACAFDAASLLINNFSTRSSTTTIDNGRNSKRRPRPRQRLNLPQFQTSISEAVLHLQRRLMMRKPKLVPKDEIRYVSVMAAKLLYSPNQPSDSSYYNQSGAHSRFASATAFQTPRPSPSPSGSPSPSPSPSRLELLSDDDLSTLRELESDLASFL